MKALLPALLAGVSLVVACFAALGTEYRFLGYSTAYCAVRPAAQVEGLALRFSGSIEPANAVESSAETRLPSNPREEPYRSELVVSNRTWNVDWPCKKPWLEHVAWLLEGVADEASVLGLAAAPAAICCWVWSGICFFAPPLGNPDRQPSRWDLWQWGVELTVLQISEALFDRDYPGHHIRRIGSVGVDVPPVSGRYGEPWLLFLHLLKCCRGDGNRLEECMDGRIGNSDCGVCDAGELEVEQSSTEPVATRLTACGCNPGICWFACVRLPHPECEKLLSPECLPANQADVQVCRALAAASALRRGLGACVPHDYVGMDCCIPRVSLVGGWQKRLGCLITTSVTVTVQVSRIGVTTPCTRSYIELCLDGPEEVAPPPPGCIEYWMWVRRYRFWEANRKVFLYPENWLEPD